MVKANRRVIADSSEDEISKDSEFDMSDISQSGKKLSHPTTRNCQKDVKKQRKLLQRKKLHTKPGLLVRKKL
jgi:hypothetical protein